MELAFEDRHLHPSKRDFSDLDLYERICSLCGFELTEEVEVIKCKVISAGIEHNR